MPQFDLMNLVFTWASHGPESQLDRVALIPTRGSGDTGDCGLFYASSGRSDSVPHLGLHGPSDSGPHPGVTGTWILYSTPGPHSDQGPLVPFWASNYTGYSGSPSGTHPYLVNLVTPWASLWPGESGP